MITVRNVGGSAYLETIEEMERDLTKVIEDFDHLALEGTKQIRPDSVGPFGSIAEDFAFGRQGRR